MVEVFLGTMFLAAAYALGSLSPAYLVARRVKDVDIRKVGSRNAGALNVFRELGGRAGVLVLGADIAKGTVVVVAALWSGLAEWTVFSAPVALTIGHNWPAVLQFQGGRGLAPVLGVSLAMLPILTMLAILPALGVIALSRSVVLGAIVGFVLLNLLTLITAVCDHLCHAHHPRRRHPYHSDPRPIHRGGAFSELAKRPPSRMKDHQPAKRKGRGQGSGPAAGFAIRNPNPSRRLRLASTISEAAAFRSAFGAGPRGSKPSGTALDCRSTIVEFERTIRGIS